MLLKAQLTSHSRCLALGEWPHYLDYLGHEDLFLYSSVYSCHLFWVYCLIFLFNSHSQLIIIFEHSCARHWAHFWTRRADKTYMSPWLHRGLPYQEGEGAGWQILKEDDFGMPSILWRKYAVHCDGEWLGKTRLRDHFKQRRLPAETSRWKEPWEELILGTHQDFSVCLLREWKRAAGTSWWSSG